RDSGATWAETKLKRNFASGSGAFAVHRVSPNIVLALCDYNGRLVRTNDFGETWTEINGFYMTIRIKKIITTPTDPDTFYILGNESGNAVVYKSVDAGVTWTKTAFSASGAVHDIAISDNGTLFVCMIAVSDVNFPNIEDASDGSVYRSADGGVTWTEITGIDYAPGYVSASSDTVTVATRGGTHGADSKIYVSRDDGANFAVLVTSEVSVGGIFCIAVSPDGNKVYYDESVQNKVDGSKLKVCEYAGSAWSAPAATSAYILDGTLMVGACGLIIDPVNPRIMYLADNVEFGVIKSTDAGTTWYLANEGMTALRIYSGAKSPQGNMYMAGRSSIYKSLDNGVTFVKVFYSTSVGAYGAFDGSEMSCNPDPTKEYIYAADKGGIIMSPDGGTTWNRVLEKNNHYMVANIVFKKDAPSTGYLAWSNLNLAAGATEKLIYKTTDFGLTWTELDLTCVGVQSLAIDEVDSSIIYAGIGKVGYYSEEAVNLSEGALWKITDDGTTISWAKFALDGKVPYKLAIDTVSPDNMYAACIDVSQQNVTYGPVYVSKDKGATWTKLAPGTADSNTPDIWAQSGGAGDIKYSYPSLYFCNGSGIYSTENGLSYTKLADSTEIGTPICLILGSLYTGTDAGVWKLTSSALSATFQNIETPKAYTFPNPFNPDKGYTILKYMVPQGQTVTSLKIRVYNVAGELVDELPEQTNLAGGQAYYFTWTGTNKNNNKCAQGVYIVLFKSNLGVTKTKLVLVRN
ncbi:MAG: hypothetical protein A3J83_05475, partial [Elusimicrobia bacterium RIFOXYA2_FULL_40_6]